ncbi:MAG: hypothetical protein AAFU85_06175, partial [Planctomycetota bacterium]
MNIRLIHSIAWRYAAGVLAIAVASATLLTDTQSARAQSALTGGWLASPSKGQTAAVNFGPDVKVVQASDVQSGGYGGHPGAISQAIGTSFGDLGSINDGQVQQVASYYPACSNCSTGSCNGSCGQTSNVCGIPCIPYRYVTVEGLIMDRGSDDSFTLSRSFLTEEFDFEWAPRITFGSVPNCVNG